MESLDLSAEFELVKVKLLIKRLIVLGLPMDLIEMM
jgi:hypothetical protein